MLQTEGNRSIMTAVLGCQPGRSIAVRPCGIVHFSLGGFSLGKMEF